MGFVKQGLVVGGFLVVVGCLCEGDWEGAEMFLVPPERWPRRALRVSMGAEPLWLGGFSFGAFPLLSSGRGFLYSHGQTAIRKRPGKSLRLH
jgi:hypothetical protein